MLFLFVVMMLDIKSTRTKSLSPKYLALGLGVAAIICIELIIVLTHADNPTLIAIGGSENFISNVDAIGEVLYTDYIIPFQISGLILLVAMVGAIVLTNTKKTAKKQNIAEQINRSSKVELVKVESGKGIE